MNFSSELSGCMEVGQSLAKVLNDASLIEGEKKRLTERKTHISQKQIGRDNHRNSLQTPGRSQGDK